MIGNKRGFTLVEVMVVVAILGVMGMAVANVSATLLNATRYSDRSQALAAVASAIRERLSYQDICTTSLATSSGLNQTMTQNSLLAGTQEISLRIPGIQSGADGRGDVIGIGVQLPADSLKIDSLKLVNVVAINANEYVAQIQLSASTTEGFVFRSAFVGGIDFYTGGNPGVLTIDHCIGQSSIVTINSCTTMGCKWDAAATTCQCQQVRSLCETGEMPVGYSGGQPICQKVGGTSCPSGQYLVALGLGTSTCVSPPN